MKSLNRIVYAKEYAHAHAEIISKFLKDNGVSIEKLSLTIVED